MLSLLATLWKCSASPFGLLIPPIWKQLWLPYYHTKGPVSLHMNHVLFIPQPSLLDPQGSRCTTYDIVISHVQGWWDGSVGNGTCGQG